MTTKVDYIQTEEDIDQFLYRLEKQLESYMVHSYKVKNKRSS